MSKDANSEGVPDLQEWLEENVSIAEAIVWEDGENNLKYTEWDDARKEDLAEIFKKVWNSETLFQSDPLPNRADLKKDDEACQVLDETDAWTMFASYTAHGLMMEIKGELDWSIKEYSESGLSELFDSIRMLYRNGGSEDYTVDDDFGYALPCEPKTAYKFLTKNKIVKSDRKSTIEAMLEWCRSNLSHSSGDIGDVDSYYDQWQYKGLPPVVRMIEGTKTLSDPSAEKRHYTAGCGGTSAFLKAVLRVVNIPVATVTVGAGHKTPYFMEEGLYLSHGDDPYNLLMINDPPIPISELFLDEKKFEEWFGEDVSDDQSAANVGRVPVELSLKYLPKYLIQDYKEDIEEGKSCSKGAVFENYSYNYTVEELEEMGLWKRLDKKLKELED